MLRKLVGTNLGPQASQITKNCLKFKMKKFSKFSTDSWLKITVEFEINTWKIIARTLSRRESEMKNRNLELMKFSSFLFNFAISPSHKIKFCKDFGILRSCRPTTPRICSFGKPRIFINKKNVSGRYQKTYQCHKISESLKIQREFNSV